jgi:hypothetical protein
MAVGIALVLVVPAPATVEIDGSPPVVHADLASGAHNVSIYGGTLLTFDHPMDRASVEAGLALFPPGYLTQRWVGDRLQLSWAVAPGEHYVVRLKGARARRGRTLPDWQLGFTSAPVPSIIGLDLGGQPMVDGQGRVPLQGALRARFVQPMDPARPVLDLDGRPVTGLEWDPSGTVATFAATLAAGSRHRVTWDQQARSAAGVAPDQAYTLAFWTQSALPSNGHVLNGNPMLVQVEDAPGARPQYGLQQADLVYESISEYEISRFTVIYYSDPPGVVGPVRSTRRIALHLREMYHGVLFSSGASDFVLGLIFQSGATYYGNDSFMSRDFRRPAPHNLMVSGDALRAHRNDFGDLQPTLVVDVPHPDVTWDGAVPAAELSVPLHHALWRYAPESGAYLRWDHGSPFTDAASGEQLRAKNLIVQQVESFLGPEIEDHNGGAHGREHVMVGEGAAEYYSNGQMVTGRWRHPDRFSPMEYVDSAGNPMTFNTGLTWVHVVYP